MQNDIQFYKNSPFLALYSMLLALCSRLRYRFFLFAGIFPYLLGQAIAFNIKGSLDWHIFFWGFLGVILTLVGVELFNEYFDAKEGGDRIFSQEPVIIPRHFFGLGIFVFMIAFFIGLYLSFRVGWPILLFSFLGFLGAYFYVGPPIRWAYRGLGEIVIALSYGPLMVLGSYYLQTKKIDILPFAASLILGLLIFSLAIANEIPDYFQDRLVDKRNIVVRMGRKNAASLYGIVLLFCFGLVALGLISNKLPFFSISILTISPLAFRAILRAKKYYDYPLKFIPAIRSNILSYTAVASLLIVSYLA